MTLSARDGRISITIGFLAIALGNAIAYRNPATGYEASIYGGTPLFFWLTAGFALALSVVVSFSNLQSRFRRRLGLLLGGASFVSILVLPITRGYYFLGEGDSLTHLGWARELQTGTLSPFELPYPVVHTLATTLASVTGVELTRVLLLVVICFVLCFLLTVPLIVRRLDRPAVVSVVGVFSAFLLLPLNFFAVHMHTHTTSQAIMFVPLVLFLFVLYYSHPDWRSFALLGLASLTLVYLHPQQAVHLLLVFLAILGVQTVSKLRGVEKSRRTTTVFSYIGLFSLIVWLWVSSLPAFESTFGGAVVGILTNVGMASAVASQGASLQQIGGSVLEVGLKLFAAPLVYSLLAGALMIAVAIDRFGGRSARVLSGLLPSAGTSRRLVFYVATGFAPLIGLFGVYVIHPMDRLYFRLQGFMMVFVTVLGALIIGRVLVALRARGSERHVRVIGTVVVLLFLVGSLPIVFPSPYIYSTSEHVPETQLSGFERTFEVSDGATTYDFVRSDPSRYGHAINGPSERPRHEYFREGAPRGDVPNGFANRSLGDYFGEPVYLTITGADRVRDPVVYEGLRFTRSDFAYLDASPTIDSVYSNGGFTLYLVDTR